MMKQGETELEQTFQPPQKASDKDAFRPGLCILNRALP